MGESERRSGMPTDERIDAYLDLVLGAENTPGDLSGGRWERSELRTLVVGALEEFLPAERSGGCATSG